MIAASPEVQRRLFDLQQVDNAIRQLEHRRANLPEQKALDENAATLAEVASDHVTSRDQLARLEQQQRWHENEIATVDSRRKGEEGRMYSGLITSERELQALRHELSTLRGKKNDLEDALLEIMEQREELEAKVTRLEARHGELTASVAQLTTARDEAASDIDVETLERTEERGQVVAELPDDVVALYHELRPRKDGVAVAELRGRTCSGCRLELTGLEYEDTLQAARTGLARCEQCGRILVITA